MDLQNCINIAINYLGQDYFNDIELSFEEDETINGLHFLKKNKTVKIIYSNRINLFRALTLVKEKHNEEEVDIKYTSRFKSVGSMLDVSRNGVLTNDSVKEFILISALMGLNRLLLYTEDTYELEGYPYFGYLRGSYSKNDLKEFVKYGEDFGVELVPCIQTLDHLERPFRWDVFNDIKDGPSNLMPLDEKSYDFIEAMIKSCRNSFNTKSIHIGMDESFRLGLGRFLSKNGYHERVELFSKHLAKVIEICKKYDFQPMIWSDMYFRLNDENAEYYDVVHLPKKTINSIPEGIELVYWDYYHDDKSVYDRMFNAHLETNRTVHFAGGAWRWSGFAPALHKSFAFNEMALLSAVEHKIENVFFTSWGDNGNECSIYSVLLSFAQYSVYNYTDGGDEKDITSVLNAVTGETKERMLLLDLPNMPDGKILAAPYNPCKFLFYQDPLLGLFDKQVKKSFVLNYCKNSNILLEAAKVSKKYGYLYKNLGLLCRVLELKADLGVRIRKFYKEQNKKELENIATYEIKEIISRVNDFRDSLEEQWFKENRRFGFDVLDGRIGYLKARLEFAGRTINNYLEGKISSIEELEKEILPFGGHDYEICWNDWFTSVAV